MTFHALEISLELISSLRPTLRQLLSFDPKLADQLRRAASSMALNLAEGRARQGRDRRHSWRIAEGSAAEVRAILRVAEAWGTLDLTSAAQSLALLDRVQAMLWRLTH